VAKFKYFGTTVTNENRIQKFRADKIRRIPTTIQYRSFCLHFGCLNNIKINVDMCKTVTLSVAFYQINVCLFENGMFGPKREEVIRECSRKLHNKELHNCSLRQISG
jgi:hypothetical protein